MLTDISSTGTLYQAAIISIFSPPSDLVNLFFARTSAICVVDKHCLDATLDVPHALPSPGYGIHILRPLNWCWYPGLMPPTPRYATARNRRNPFKHSYAFLTEKKTEGSADGESFNPFETEPFQKI